LRPGTLIGGMLMVVADASSGAVALDGKSGHPRAGR